HTLVRNAQFNLQQSQLQYQQTASIVQSNLLKAWKNLNAASEAMKLEEDNILIARENVAIALERFRIGSSNNLEVLLAQRSFADATARLATARYDAKAAETELKRLNGELVK
ncbi:MAG: TolC family protein, partial [Bacteroidia bacterium]